MSIKNEQFLKDLQPFARMTVVPGVTVGDLNFTSAQSVFSTGYIRPSADNLFAANAEVDMFQAAIGDNGQGLAAGQIMSRGQTNWLDSAGRLPANEVFVGIRCLFSLYRHSNSSALLTAGASFALTAGVGSVQAFVPSVETLYELSKMFSWEYQTGDGIIRNSGPVSGYPQGGGVWEAPLQNIAPAVLAAQGAVAVQNGTPAADLARELAIPFMFLPNINTRVKIKCGSAIGTTAGTFLISGITRADYLAFRQTFQGYKLTMPV